MKIFSIVFDDNSVYEGGASYSETKWKDIPTDKKIRSIFYTIPFGDVLCLSGYDSYYHIVEAVTDLNGKNKNVVKIDIVRLLAKKDNSVKIYKFKLDDSKKIDIEIKDVNDSFIKSLNPIFWR